jgi:putative phosphoribosyl transferase
MLNHTLITFGAKALTAELCIVRGAPGTVVFAQAGSRGHLDKRSQHAARMLGRHGMNTLLFDLLSTEEAATPENAHNIDWLTQRLLQAIDALPPAQRQAPIGLLASGHAAAAALLTAAQRPADVTAVVSRGGRPDLAGDALRHVRAATLLIVGGSDAEVLALNRQAYTQLTCDKRIEVIPRATHLFEEAGALEALVHSAADWFAAHFKPPGAGSA